MYVGYIAVISNFSCLLVVVKIYDHLKWGFQRERLHERLSYSIVVAQAFQLPLSIILLTAWSKQAGLRTDTRLHIRQDHAWGKVGDLWIALYKHQAGENWLGGDFSKEKESERYSSVFEISFSALKRHSIQNVCKGRSFLCSYYSSDFVETVLVRTES